MEISIIGGFIHLRTENGSSGDTEAVHDLIKLKGVIETEEGCLWELDVLTNHKTPNRDFPLPGKIEVGQVIGSHTPYQVSFWPKDSVAQEIIHFLFEHIHPVYNLRTAMEWDILARFKQILGVAPKGVSHLRINADTLCREKAPRLDVTVYSPGIPVS